MVEVHEEDRDALRFLWVNGSCSEETGEVVERFTN